MLHLLNLLAAIALLVWGTQTVRTGILSVFGESLRHILATSLGSKPRALLAGLGVTSLVQSATATCMIVASFLDRNLVTTSAALTVMLGADVGSSLMAVVFSLDLSWLSPLLIFVGVVLYVSRQKTTAGRLGRVAMGLGLITLALQLIIQNTRPMIEAPAIRGLLVALPNEVLFDIVVGSFLTVMAYSSLAIVLLTATLAVSGLVPETVALGLVVGANLGSGILAVLTTAKAPIEARRLPLGNLLFKIAGAIVAIPFLPHVHDLLLEWVGSIDQQVVLFHLCFNVGLAGLFVALTGPMGKAMDRWMVAPTNLANLRPQHLDLVALSTPSLAISCAEREALHQADVIETMLRGVLPVIRNNDLVLAEQLRQQDDTVDDLYTAIKLYLTQISRESLSESESRRWTDVMSFTINMEQVGDIIERILQDVEDKKIRKDRSFSEAGMAEIVHLHERLITNLRLGMSVFLSSNVREAKRLLEEKARFRELEHEYATSHLNRLQDNTAESIETSSLHIDLISDLKRINSHICSIAYPILESAGALSQTRIRASRFAPLEEEPARDKTRSSRG
ncbi:MAG: Na/Pi cotransporter family protein [Leptothrix ochracea]|uniref:Na/Pi cotransporter family protein n=1 Tax=Leptothrix ochracea TaxID=735331 RepID=UPI0034E1D46A